MDAALFAITRRTLLASLAALGVAARAQPAKRASVARPLNPADTLWLAHANDIGLQVLASYAHTSEVTPRNLDTAFATWKNDGRPQKAPAKDVAQGLGALFGNLVVTQKQADWAVVTDSFGTELAVRSTKGGDLFPIASVWKRIDPKNGDIKFFEPIWTLVVDKQFAAR